MYTADCGLNYYVMGIFINVPIFQESPYYKMSIMLDLSYIKMTFLKDNDSACPRRVILTTPSVPWTTNQESQFSFF